MVHSCIFFNPMSSPWPEKIFHSQLHLLQFQKIIGNLSINLVSHF